VGLALRHAGAAPLEVELVPDRVAAARDSAKRAPFLVMAMICLFAALLVGVFYFKKADQAVRSHLAGDQVTLGDLTKYDAALVDADKQVDLLTKQSAQLEQAVNDRSYWCRLLNMMNNAFETDYVWLTSMEVLKDGASMTPALAATPGAAAPLQPPPSTTATGLPVATGPAYTLRVQGLWRKNDVGNEQVVNKYFDDLKKAQEYFAPSEDKVEVDLGLADDRYAYDFKFRLPLVKGMKFDK
jgi:hypothetical protein